jgi:hypothetical protein
MINGVNVAVSSNKKKRSREKLKLVELDNQKRHDGVCRLRARSIK